MITFIALPIRGLVAVSIIQAFGYHVTFLVLGSFAIGSLLLWVGFAGLLRPGLRRLALR